jgi:[acyl-carrier-protein] S-malonyltransferase
MTSVMFPGQGSQHPGMGKDLYYNVPPSREIFERVSKAADVDMAVLCFETDEAVLRQTQNAQLALYCTGLAAWQALSSANPGLKPQMMAGHSVGEYAALAAAGILEVEDGARLVKKRGELMAAAGSTRPGTMAAVLGLDRDELSSVVDEAGSDGVCVIANDNCPGQLVISGDIDAVQKASCLAGDRGARRVLPLNVSGAFHSPLMDESAKVLSQELAQTEFHPGWCPVVSNVTAKVGDDWTALLTQQLSSPVLWTDSVRFMIGEGSTTFLECGAGEVLSGLVRRIDKSLARKSIVDTATLADAEQFIKENA